VVLGNMGASLGLEGELCINMLGHGGGVVGNSVHMWKGEIGEKLTKTNPGLSGES
jgi:hypothetical protein